MSNTQENNQLKKVAKIILNVVLWVFLAFAVATMILAFASAANDYGVPTIGNKVILNVQSGSMEPTFYKGDMLIATVLNDEDKANLKENDIITFFADLNGDGIKELNTHRIISYNGTYFKTKGDNNQIADTYDVYARDIVATWKEGDAKIGGLGGFISFLQGRVGFFIVIILPLTAFFIYELVKFILLMVQLKGGKKKISPEEEAIRQRLYEEYLLKQRQEAAEKENTAAENADDGKTSSPELTDKAE